MSRTVKNAHTGTNAVDTKGAKTMNKRLISLFVKERDAACKSCDVRTFRMFYQKWMHMGVYRIPLPSDDRVIEILMRKCLYHTASATPEEKQLAKEWLTAHGCDTDL